MTDRDLREADARAGFAALQSARERIARHCVCCGSTAVEASPAVLMPFVAHRTFGWRPVVIDDSWGLKTIASGHAYSICNSLGCPDCGLVFLDIRFSDDELSRLYEDYRGPAYNDLREGYEPGYKARNALLTGGIDYLDRVEQFLAPHLPPRPDVLDWGGDTGNNTPFRRQGGAIEVYDISGKPVLEGVRAVSREQALAGRHDLVVLSNVLEHVPYPADPLLEIREAMTATSVLYVEVPHEDLMRLDTAHRHRAKKHWHEHINFFSRVSLERLLAHCGFDTVAVNEIAVHSGGKSAFLLQLACKVRDVARPAGASPEAASAARTR